MVSFLYGLGYSRIETGRLYGCYLRSFTLSSTQLILFDLELTDYADEAGPEVWPKGNSFSFFLFIYLFPPNRSKRPSLQ